MSDEKDKETEINSKKLCDYFFGNNAINDIKHIDKKYLFSWNGFPESDRRRLKSYLIIDLGLVWVNDAEIQKTDDKSIRIFKENKKAEITLNDAEDEATLTYESNNKSINIELVVKRENNALNIYDAKLKRDIKTFLEKQQELECEKLTLKEAHCLIIELQKLALEIWKELLNSSLEYIGFRNEKVGVEELYNYQKAFREFEEVLYGSVRYRDHINHCINLYLMGEMLFREKLKYDDLRMYTTTDSKDRRDDKSAIFCIIAMTHDLGYPIEVIHATNEKYREMFSHYKNIKLIEPAVDFPLSYHGIFEYLIDILSLAIKPETYLFSWDKVPATPKKGDEERLLRAFLKNTLHLDWIDGSEVSKKGERTIEVTATGNEKTWVKIELLGNQGKATLSISDGRTVELIAKEEKNELKVYIEKGYLDYIRVVKEEDEKKTNCIEIESILQTQHLRPFISTALLEYNHGLFSCMKLIEHLKMFKEDYDISFDDLKSCKGKGKGIDEKFLICQEILKTIIYHSTENIRTGIRDESLLYLWFNLLDDLCEWSRFTMGEGYTKIPGFCTPYVKEFNMKKVEIEFEYGNATPEYVKPPDYVKPYKLFETIARKYYQIIKKVGTNIIITIKDIEDDDRTFKFEYKPNDSNPFDFKIDCIELDSEGILKKMISEKGLSEFFTDKTKRC